jgi:hypothetical protein
MKAVVERAEVRDTPARLAALEQSRGDVMAAGNLQALVLTPADAFGVAVAVAATAVPGEPA